MIFYFLENNFSVKINVLNFNFLEIIFEDKNNLYYNSNNSNNTTITHFPKIHEICEIIEN